MKNPIVLYIARVTEGGHVFEAVDIMPSLARSRLFREIEAFKGGASTQASRLADSAEIVEITQGAFRRYDAPA